ncbi:MAG: hypothetical protein AAB767_01140 [Patescibacteria group bacterium]
MNGALLRLLFKIAVNGLALFGSAIGLYFSLKQTFPLHPWFILLLTAIGALLWGVKSMLYFRNELARIVTQQKNRAN